MSITLVEAESCIEGNGFTRVSATKKVIGFKSKLTGGTLYLRTDQGFPDHADVAVDPNLDVTTLIAINGVELNARNPLRHSSNLKEFPTRINGGKNPIHYGRALQVFSGHALLAMCQVHRTLK